MAAIQRPSSNMDPLQRSYSNRSLLPAERQIIDALGLSLEEYWEFCRLADCKAKERGEAYALIPDVRGEPGTIAIISLVVGVLSTAASVLLRPEVPSFSQEERKEPGTLRTADVRGQTKFAQFYSFDSLQDLAALGSIVPLVFADRDESKGIGGIRAKGLLIWSQLLSKGSHQELKALMTLGLSILAAIPDAEGLAVGDQLLRNYQEARYAAYFLNVPETGNRVNEINRFAGALPALSHTDVFLAYDRLTDQPAPLFSGVRTPNSQKTFGCHSPISNGAPYWLPYDYIQSIGENRSSADEKRRKINTPYIGRQGMEYLNNVNLGANPATHQINVGDVLMFRSSNEEENPDRFPPHGLEDVNTAVRQRITSADSKIARGDLYMFGSCLVQCEEISTDKAWEKGDESKQYFFRCKEPGAGYFVGADVSVGNLPYGQHLQQVDIATISNNVECDQTEIGIKSIVFKRIDNFANVNSQPSDAVLEDLSADSVAFSLGRVSSYQTRFSFFKIEQRLVSASNDAPFADISSKQIFAVKGNTPQPQYNALRISHPRGQHEFRIVPISGSTAYGLALNSPVQLLSGAGNSTVSGGGGFYISYTGEPIILTEAKLSNEEFQFKGFGAIEGQVTAFDSTTIGELPETAEWQLENTAIDYDATTGELRYGVFVNQNDSTQIVARFNSVTVELGSEFRKGTFYGSIPGSQDWQVSTPEKLNLTGSANYIEVDAAGTFVGAVYAGVDVTAQTQQGSTVVLSAIYRRGVRTLQAEGTTSFVQDPTTGPQYDPYTQNAYFGVWVRRNDGIETGVWNGQTVVLNQAIEVVPGQIGRFVKGNQRDFFPSINCDVYEIIRQVQVVGTAARYFVGIEKGAYNVITPAYDTFYIEKYVFDAEESPFVYAPAEYTQEAGSGTDGSGLSINASSFATGQWQWVIASRGSNYKVGERIVFNFPDGTVISPRVTEVARVEGVAKPGLNPLDALADFPKYDLESTSHQDNPEHEIVYINEQVRSEQIAQYDNLSLLGIRILAGKDWTSLGQLSAYIKKGIQVERLITDSGVATTTLVDATNNFPEIAYNLLVNPRIGAGKKVPRDSVDRASMTIAAQFCKANGFTWDGVVGEKTALREFIFRNGAYNFLDFTIVGGKFALKPSVPFKANNGEIDHAQDINKQVVALFTDGNMKDMQVNFLTPKERQLFKAVVSFRKEVENGFSSQETIQVRLADSYGGSDTDPEESLDLSAFCTSRQHAEKIAQHSLLLRKYTTHTIDFKTTPSSAMTIAPGDYIKVISNATHTNRFNNGSIDSSGSISSTSALGDGTHDIFYWRPGLTAVQEGALSVSSGTTGDSTFFGSVFTKKMTTQDKRIYKIDSLTVDSEGFVDISATFQELTSIGSLATMNLDPRQFLVTN